MGNDSCTARLALTLGGDGKPKGLDHYEKRRQEWYVVYNILFTGAVLNSSNKKVDVNAFAKSMEKQIEKMFTQVLEKNGDGSVKYAVEATAQITAITDKKDLKSDETLFNIEDGTNNDFKTDDPGSTVVGLAKNGKEIAINADGVDDMMNGNNSKTGPHEAGHTAGLGIL